MRTPPLLSPVLAAALISACVDRVPTGGRPISEHRPQFDHGSSVPAVDVDANNFALRLYPNHLFNAFYKGAGVYFAGELSYGNAADAVFLHDTRGFRASPRLQHVGLPVAVAAPGPFAAHQTASLLVERTGQETGPSVPLGLVVVRETFAFGSAPDDDYVMLKYTLHNAGAKKIRGLHVGQVHDYDLAPNFADDVVAYDAAGDFVRVVSASELTAVAGHALLRLPTTSYRAFGNPAGPLPSTDPSTNAEWFDVLSGGIVDPGPFGPGDVRHALSHGPLTVRAGESEVIAFVLAAGDDAADLAANIAAARARYDALPHEARRPYPVVAAEVRITPAPLDPRTAVEFTAVITGIPRKQLPLVTAAATHCGAVDVTTVPATSLVRDHSSIRATFPVSNLATRLGFGAGDEILCGSRLTDGTLVVARTTPEAAAHTVAPVTRLTSSGTNRAPTWSPDGASIAFASDRSGTFAIWRMNVTAGEPSALRLTDGPDDHSPDWFGATIAFGRGAGLVAGEIYTVSDAGGAVTLVNADGRNPRYSPDGGTLAFTRVTDDFHIWTMSVAGGPETQVTSGGFEFHPEWSADGSEIYFTEFVGAGTIFKLPAGGGTRVQVTPSEGLDNRHPAISPDGAWLAFTSGRNPELVLQELATGHHTVIPLDPFLTVAPVTNAETNQNLEFSPDGTKLLFAAGGQIWVADLSALLP